MRILIAAALAVFISAPAMAEGEFSEGSQAKGFGSNLQGSEPALFKARVVDILCELTGDCPDDCGAGKRAMGLLREADGKLVLTAKNAQAQFQGATVDMAAYCGQTVTVDGFLVGDPEVAPTKFYMVKAIQRDGSDKWGTAKRWTRIWNRAHKDLAAQKGPWFRKHPPVLEQIEATGWLGLGAEVDAAFIEENY